MPSLDDACLSNSSPAGVVEPPRFRHRMNTPPGTYRYGSERVAGEGWRLGVARHLPRGVRREDWVKRGYFDLWLPLLAPSAGLVKEYLGGKIAWTAFSRRYRAEMKKPECRQVIELLAGFSGETPFSLGCFCENESRCHRSLLHQLVTERRADLPPIPRVSHAKDVPAPVTRLASPVCFAQWDEDEAP